MKIFILILLKFSVPTYPLRIMSFIGLLVLLISAWDVISLQTFLEFLTNDLIYSVNTLFGNYPEGHSEEYASFTMILTHLWFNHNAQYYSQIGRI